MIRCGYCNLPNCSCGKEQWEEWNDPIADLQRDNAQARELLLNQAAYIKTLQDENLRLNKSGKAVLRDQMRLTNERTEKCIEQEALIETLATELKHNAEVFRRYQQLHILKHTEDGNDKAHANGSYADRCESALKLVEQWKVANSG